MGTTPSGHLCEEWQEVRYKISKTIDHREMSKKKYIKPEVETVMLKDRLMDLELPVSNSFVDDEAAKKRSFEDEEEDMFGPNRKELWED